MKVKIKGDEYNFEKVVKFEDIDYTRTGNKTDWRQPLLVVALILTVCFLVGVVF